MSDMKGHERKGERITAGTLLIESQEQQLNHE